MIGGDLITYRPDIQELDDGMRFVVSGFGHRFELFVPVLDLSTISILLTSL